ncbi:MAG: M23 family metallopeptidase [Saprospiraceae bacterium]
MILQKENFDFGIVLFNHVHAERCTILKLLYVFIEVKIEPMFKSLLFCFFSIISLAQLIAQEPPEASALKVYDEKVGSSTIAVFADNSADAPISVTVEFPEMKNISMDVKLPYTAVIPPNTTKHKVMDIEMAVGKAVSFRYSYGMVLGDTKTAKHDDNFQYQLPFKKGSSYFVGQGYNGRFSHSGTNAIDFDMDIGTKVCAARAGTVIFVKEDGRKGCKHESCSASGNYIVIMHTDGSFGRYVHLDHKGVCVKPGQKVEQGEVIGKSGNTGWSSGPHLHFEVYVPVPNGYITVATKFKTAETKGVYLEEAKSYSH